MEALGRAVLLGLLIGWLFKPETNTDAGGGGGSRPPNGPDAGSGSTEPPPAPERTQDARGVRMVPVRRHKRRVREAGDPPATDTPDPKEGETET